MNPKTKKILYIALFALDVAVVLFLVIVPTIVAATMPSLRTDIDKTTFIGFFQANPNAILFAFVLPAVVLLGLNIFILIKFVKKVNARKKVQLNELSAEEKEALRKELMKDLASPKEEEKKEE
jgi:hypothetical protein